MPLIDRPDFRAWFEARTGGLVGRRHDAPDVCTGCGGPLGHEFAYPECIVCLAEQYGTDTAELWLAEAFAGLVRVASDPAALGRVLGAMIDCARGLSAAHMPPDRA